MNVQACTSLLKGRGVSQMSAALRYSKESVFSLCLDVPTISRSCTDLTLFSINEVFKQICNCFKQVVTSLIATTAYDFCRRTNRKAERHNPTPVPSYRCKNNIFILTLAFHVSWLRFSRFCIPAWYHHQAAHARKSHPWSRRRCLKERLLLTMSRSFIR